MIVSYGHVIILATVLFLMGAVCSIVRKNLIMTLIGVGIMFNAAGIVLVGGSLYWNQLDGQVFVLFIMGVAAAKVAVGLALIVYLQSRTGLEG